MKKEIIKDFIEVEKIEQTFYDGRECDYCFEKIADQEHATRRFCPKRKDEQGNIVDCKSEFHREQNAPEKVVHVELINKHKGIAKRIDELLLKKSSEVLLSDLDAYDIELTSCLDYLLKPNGVLTSIFLEHTIVTNPISKTHKITQNVK